eukprot:366231-Chlamydomonas_euryale.AAC.2
MHWAVCDIVEVARLWCEQAKQSERGRRSGRPPTKQARTIAAPTRTDMRAALPVQDREEAWAHAMLARHVTLVRRTECDCSPRGYKAGYKGAVTPSSEFVRLFEGTVWKVRRGTVWEVRCHWPACGCGPAWQSQWQDSIAAGKTLLAPQRQQQHVQRQQYVGQRSKKACLQYTSPR